MESITFVRTADNNFQECIVEEVFGWILSKFYRKRCAMDCCSDVWRGSMNRSMDCCAHFVRVSITFVRTADSNFQECIVEEVGKLRQNFVGKGLRWIVAEMLAWFDDSFDGLLRSL